MKLSHLPNIITILRSLLVFPIVLALYSGNYKLAFYIFIFAAATDGLDGLLARRFRWFSRFGSIADPLADKFLMISTFLMLTYLGKIPLWLLTVIIIRDLIIISGATLYHYMVGAYELAPSLVSKTNTALQFFLIVVILFQASYFLLPQSWIVWLLYAVFITNILSLVHYVWVWSKKALRYSKGSMNENG